MSETTDPNKLAYKDTPGPWYVRNTGTSILVKHENEVVCSIYDLYREKATANAHMISATPEAVELLADILEWVDEEKKVTSVEDFYLMPAELINRIENVLKKAYNF